MVKTVPQDGVDAVQVSLDEAHIVFFFRFVALAFFTCGFSLRAPRRFQCATERSFETLLGAFLVEFVVSCVSLPWSPSLNGTSTKTPSAPFFRVPYFVSTPAALDLLQSRGILVFGADLWAADWENIEGDRASRDHPKGNHSAARSAGAEDGSYDARVPALPARSGLLDRTLGTGCCPRPKHADGAPH